MKKDLIIRVFDFNSIHNDDNFIKQLRKLTINKFSGMNYELNNLSKSAKKRKVKCRIITVIENNEIIAWGLLSREPTDFSFPTGETYDPIFGFLFQVFVDNKHRKMGIGSEIIKVARRLAGPYKLCIAPHNKSSECFFNKFKYRFEIL